MKTIAKVGCGAIVGVVGLVVILVVLVGVGANEASDEADKTAITTAQFRTIATGDTKAEVYAKVGRPDPDDQQEFESEVPDELGGGTTRSDCDYWAKEGDFGIPSFQVCYGDRGTVESRNRF